MRFFGKTKGKTLELKKTFQFRHCPKCVCVYVCVCVCVFVFFNLSFSEKCMIYKHF